jgi:mannose/fructose-specific phosphotransferase system component IIA
MSNGPVRGVVVSHAALGTALVDAVQAITGQADLLIPVTNEGCSAASLFDRVRAAVGTGECVVFVDVAGGSCCRAAASLVPSLPGLHVVTGVNLPMLIDFVMRRDGDAARAAERAVGAGASGIDRISK